MSVTVVNSGEKKLGFRDRIERGHNFEGLVQRYLLENFGLRTYPYGLGTLLPAARQSLITLNDPTSQHIRYAPDLLCPMPRRNFSFFIECKSGATTTPYFSYNLDCYNVGCRWAYSGIRILCVFPEAKPFSGFRAEWIENLPIEKTLNKSGYLKSVNGSQKPFVLIPKDKLRSLGEIISDLLDMDVTL